MLHLRTLGAIRLERDDGSSLDLLRRPKCAAVLVYGAVAAPQAVLRDTLRGIFWPESSEPRARRALNQTLYELRAVLGSGVVKSDGPLAIAVDPTRLTCDASTFARALASGAPADALGAYRGDFLPGFWIPGAPEFERWTESTRARLRFEAAGAAATLVSAATKRREIGEAIRWARCRLAITPTDDTALRDLLLLLDTAGDRAAAAETYRAYSHALAAQLELRPSAETQRLAQRIMSDVAVGSAVAAAPVTVTLSRARRPSITRPRTAKLLLALAAMAAMLVIVVPRTSRPSGSSVATAAYLTRLGRELWSRRDPESLHLAGGLFSRAFALDPRSAPALSGLADTYSLESWYGNSGGTARVAAARRLARVAVHLNDRSAAAHASLAAVKAWFDHDWLGSEEEFRRAIALDPGYATAHQWYGLALAVQGRLDQAESQVRTAYRLAPASAPIAADLATVLFWRGHNSAALDAVHSALQLDSTSQQARSALWRLYAAQGRREEAIDALGGTLASQRGTAVIARDLRDVFRARGFSGALEWWAQVLALVPGQPDRAIKVAVLYGLLGRDRDALRWLEVARREHSPYLQFAALDPAFRRLRGTSAFRGATLDATCQEGCSSSLDQ